MIASSRLHDLIEEARSAAESLVADGDERDLDSLVAGYQSWDQRNKIFLKSAFEKSGFLDAGPTENYSDFRGLNYPFGTEAAGGSFTSKGIRSDIETKLRRLSDLQANLDLYETGGKPEKAKASRPSRVFIVHGHDSQLRLQVELLVQKATGESAVVLANQPNAGATLIEKLERELTTDSFVIVLLTSDDVGRAEGESELQSRARQNVVLELGFAMGLIGRSRTMILHSDGVEIPSDIDGLAYYPADSHGAWRPRVLGELRLAGIEVDANAALDL